MHISIVKYFVVIQPAGRIIQSIPSPKAEPFKRWLAKVGYERIQEIENLELAQGWGQIATPLFLLCGNQSPNVPFDPGEIDRCDTCSNANSRFWLR